jgi:hypothetical protein
MDRKTLPGTALVATALLFTQRPMLGSYSTDTVRAGSAPTPVSQPQQRAKPAGAAATDTPASRAECGIGAHCDALVPYRETGPWTAACSWFATDSRSTADRGESLGLEDHEPEKLGRSPQDWCLPEKPNAVRLQFVLVTIPDPVTTHMALYFDRTVEAIEAAAQRHSLFLTRHWLPWSLPGGSVAGGDTSENLRVNEILVDQRTTQPGVLIFTGPEPEPEDNRGTSPQTRTPRVEARRTTFVFLVGESPTAGINKAQFKNAVAYETLLCDSAGPTECENTPYRVVGPFFSGSVPSAIDLQAYLDAQQQPRTIDFLSGSISSSTQGVILQRHGLSFDDTLRGDEDARKYLLEFLQHQGLLTENGSNIAILQEDETKFGNMPVAAAVADPAFPALHLITFPRELSRLRNAAADSFGQPVITPGQDFLAPTEGVSWNWRDVGKGEDSVPSFSGAQEPLSQQAVLLAISDVIKKQKIQYVGIVATDIFDILFLSKFLKMTTPNTRLFVLDADLLMVNGGGESRELDGTLAVTTYPLIPRSDEWLKQTPELVAPGRSLNLFPSRITQGIYDAVCLQLSPGGGSQKNPPCPRAGGVNAPHVAAEQPVWLTMVGRTGFWPVNLYEATRAAGVTAAATSATRRVGPQRIEFDPPDVTTVLLADSLLLWGVVHLFGMCFGYVTGNPWLAQFRVRSRTDRGAHAQYQTYYLICATLALSAMLGLLAISIACVKRLGGVSIGHVWFSPMPGGFIAVVGLGLLAAAVGVAIRNHPERIPRPIFYLPWLAYGLSLIVWSWLSAGSEPENQFFSVRAFYLSNGVSPLLPLEFLLVIYYAWAWSFIRKERLSESKQVRVPELAELGPAGTGLKDGCAMLVEATDGLVFNPRVAAGLLLGFAAAIALLIRPWESLKSVEGPRYDWYFLVMFLYICLLIGLVWGRYMYIWNRMRWILRALERTPLRRAFSRLPENLYSWSPLWYENAERRAYFISARSLECFQGIVRRTGSPGDAEARLKTMTTALGRVVALDCIEAWSGSTASRSDDRSVAVSDLQRILSDTASKILAYRLVPHWARQGGSDTLDDEYAEDAKRQALTSETELLFLQEEFVALRYVGLIHYETSQLKNLVMLLVSAFVLALASIGSYPFLGGRLLIWTMAAVFVLFGAGVIASFAQMARDAILSRLSGTDAGKLDLSFYLRVLSYGALPVLALLASQYPSVGRSLVSWLQPALNAMH